MGLRHIHFGQSCEVKSHAFQIIVRGQRPFGECQTANAAQREVIIGFQRGTGLKDEFVPSGEAVRDTGALALDGGRPRLDDLMDEHQGTGGNDHGGFRRHGRAQHVQHRLVLFHGVLIGAGAGVGMHAIPGNPKRAAHARIRFVLGIGVIDAKAGGEIADGGIEAASDNFARPFAPPRKQRNMAGFHRRSPRFRGRFLTGEACFRPPRLTVPPPAALPSIPVIRGERHSFTTPPCGAECRRRDFPSVSSRPSDLASVWASSPGWFGPGAQFRCLGERKSGFPASASFHWIKNRNNVFR